MKKGKLPLWILGYAAVILVIAVVINVAMGFSIPTNAGLTAPTWLGFWGSYLGGAIGCIPAFLALQHSITESKHHRKEAQQERQLSARPVFDCRIRYVSRSFARLSASQWLYIGPSGDLHEDGWDERIDFDNLYPECNYIELSNCGLGSALQAQLFFNDHSVDLFHIKNGESAYYILDPSYKYFESLGNESTVRFVIKCQDIYGNYYSQELLFKVFLCFEGRKDYLQFQTESIGTANLLPVESK